MVAFCNHLLQDGSFEDLRLHTYTISSFGPSAFETRRNFPTVAASPGKWRRFWALWAVSWVPQKALVKKLIFDEGVTWMSQEVRTNGSFKWLISPTYTWGVPWVYTPLILTFDPNFLGHPDIGESHDLQTRCSDHQLGTYQPLKYTPSMVK